MQNQRLLPQVSVATPTGRLCSVFAAALLSACASTPLPPWPASKSTASNNDRPAVVRPQPPATAVPPSTQAAPGTLTGAITGAVSSRPISPSTVDAPDRPLPYSAAVAARFPVPAVQYNTPGLQAGRRAFTTQAELNQWLQELSRPQKTGARTHLLEIGRSQQGTPITALLLTHASKTDINSLEASARPTVLLLAQQYGDQPAGAEALLVLASELAQGLLEPLLDRIHVLIVPRANPDGATLGQRLTANGVDLDQDHLLLRTPEAQALAKLVRNYNPIAIFDAQEYAADNGFQTQFNLVQRYDMLLQHSTTGNLPEFITKADIQWYLQPMEKALSDAGLSHHWYYQITSGKRFAMGAPDPQLMRNISGLKNAASLMLASRGADLGRADMQRRVHAQVTALSSALRSTAERAKELEQVRTFVAREIASQACRSPMVLSSAPSPTQQELLAINPNSGADTPLRVDWDSALQLQALKKRQRPCGYWLASSADAVVHKLQLLGVQVMRIAEPATAVAQTYQAAANASPGAPQPNPLTTVSSALDIAAGSYYVPLNQPLANVALAALEPDTAHSYYSHGVLTSLEQIARVTQPPALIFEDSE